MAEQDPGAEQVPMREPDPPAPTVAQVLARQRPREPQDFWAGGAGAEVTLAEATAAWSAYRLRPRVLRDVRVVDTALDLLGHRLATPVLAAPLAYQGPLHPDAEVATARGVAAAGSLHVLSMRSSRPLELVADGPWWLQVYVTRDRALTEGIVRRAVAAGASALVLTGDTPYVGRKARAGRPHPLGSPETLANLPPGTTAAAAEVDPSLTPDAIGWLAEVSGLPVLVKGVLRADDAAACLAAGAAGLVVSNHGGRQLDRAVSTASALPEVVAAAGAAPVLVDGGLRSGLDVLVALALGARAVLVGRPLLWALAAEGADGVGALLAAYTRDLAHAMGLAGAARLADVTPDLLA